MTDQSQLADFVANLKDVPVLVAGDVMLDRYVYGDASRISPEAPIPVLAIDHETSMLGGAGNVVRNLVAIGAKVEFVTAVGDDQAGREVRHLLEQEKGVSPRLAVEPGRKTSIKTRFCAGSQQLLRADHETVGPLAKGGQGDVLEAVSRGLAEAKILILSDYGKGVLSPDLLPALIERARAAGRQVVADPKGIDYSRYRGATLLTPNRRELSEAAQMPVDSDEAVVAAARHLMAGCGIGNVLVTRSQDGMTLVEGSGGVHHLKAEAREVFDVSGAGDTVIATLSAALGAGIALVEAAKLANAAAGIVVGKVGTAVVHPDELVAAFHHQDLWQAEVKLVSLEQAKDRLRIWRLKGNKIGFTNGCFDLLHPGHVSLLSQARAACDKLVVGLNSDASVQRLKGPTRPVQSEASRAAVLASLASVDLVVIFGEDTPLDLIAALKPELLVKGADYTVDKVVGADLVQSWGGRVLLADLAQGHSTSATIARMKT
ncbi:MAG: D-glycero-beta-D-manno-heptose-7-phosphate kinase [Rhodospirillales bacterium]|jgi:D-beta-D-heptose 7-phosphate kinase/D-beta-D-heptose 1-phosphate adenosyltransferase|nr:D-glycero-beta-D-manno-heptose-7-phosphate kinase [Rhodospirillales bacterium]